MKGNAARSLAAFYLLDYTVIDDEPVAESIEVMLPVIKVINTEIATNKYRNKYRKNIGKI